MRAGAGGSPAIREVVDDNRTRHGGEVLNPDPGVVAAIGIAHHRGRRQRRRSRCHRIIGAELPSRSGLVHDRRQRLRGNARARDGRGSGKPGRKIGVGRCPRGAAVDAPVRTAGDGWQRLLPHDIPGLVAVRDLHIGRPGADVDQSDARRISAVGLAGDGRRVDGGAHAGGKADAGVARSIGVARRRLIDEARDRLAGGDDAGPGLARRKATIILGHDPGCPRRQAGLVFEARGVAGAIDVVDADLSRQGPIIPYVGGRRVSAICPVCQRG